MRNLQETLPKLVPSKRTQLDKGEVGQKSQFFVGRLLMNDP